MHKMRTAKWVDFFITEKEDRLFLLAIKPNYAIIKTGQWANYARQSLRRMGMRRGMQKTKMLCCRSCEG